MAGKPLDAARNLESSEGQGAHPRTPSQSDAAARPEATLPGPESVAASSPAITSAQLARLGVIGRQHLGRGWFLSFMGEGIPDLYLQDLESGELWTIRPDGKWAFLGEQSERSLWSRFMAWLLMPGDPHQDWLDDCRQEARRR